MRDCWRVSEYTHKRSQLSSVKNRARALCHSQSSSSQIKRYAIAQRKWKLYEKNTRLELEIFSSHTEQRAFDGFLIFFFSAILCFSPNAGASCVLFALLLSSWPGLTCHVKQFLAFYIRSLPRALDSTAKVSQAVIVVFRGAFLCEPVQGISNISNSPH